MIHVSEELISERIGRLVHFPEDGSGGVDCNPSDFKPLKPSNKFIDWLFRHYNTSEMAEEFYDSRPDVPQDWPDDWVDREDYRRYWTEMCRSHQDQRIRLNNWVDVYQDGVWDMSQRFVDKVARATLKEVRSFPVQKKCRMWWCNYGNEIIIYWYGRDFDMRDFVWVLTRKDGSHGKVS